MITRKNLIAVLAALGLIFFFYARNKTKTVSTEPAAPVAVVSKPPTSAQSLPNAASTAPVPTPSSFANTGANPGAQVVAMPHYDDHSSGFENDSAPSPLVTKINTELTDHAFKVVAAEAGLTPALPIAASSYSISSGPNSAVHYEASTAQGDVEFSFRVSSEAPGSLFSAYARENGIALNAISRPMGSGALFFSLKTAEFTHEIVEARGPNGKSVLAIVRSTGSPNPQTTARLRAAFGV